MMYYQFIETDERKKCKISKAIARETNLSDNDDYTHNMIVTYACRGKSEYRHSICKNGGWDPEVTCTGKLFITFQNLFLPTL